MWINVFNETSTEDLNSKSHSVAPLARHTYRSFATQAMLRQDEDENTSSKTTTLVKPHLPTLIHEIKLQDQKIYLSPPLQHARLQWFQNLSNWQSTLTKLKRIEVARYELSIQQTDKDLHESLKTYSSIVKNQSIFLLRFF